MDNDILFFFSEHMDALPIYERLASFPTSKGTIRLPLNQPMPLELIADIARWCEESNGK